MYTLQDMLHVVSPSGPIKTQYPVTMESVGQVRYDRNSLPISY